MSAFAPLATGSAQWTHPMDIEVIDDVLPNLAAYRQRALGATFVNIEIAGDVFRGIALETDRTLPDLLEALRPGAVTVLSFFRKSPAGQVEPNYIHSDAEMGDYTGILYLNPDPPPGDGTVFWQRRSDGARRGLLIGEAGKRLDEWEPRQRIGAKFGRLLIFQADLFHSRALEANYGHGDDARLTQVVFLRGGR